MKQDYTQNFIFEDLDILGSIVNIKKSFKEAIIDKCYPVVFHRLLGKLACASLLMNLSTNRFINFEIKGEGDISLLMAESHKNRTFRVHAIWDKKLIINEQHITELFRKGLFVVTIDNKKGMRRQSIIPMNKPDIVDVLEDYFRQSEQIQTFYKLAYVESHCACMMLQQLPQQIEDTLEQRQESWNRLLILSDTLKDDELLKLNASTILRRVFSEEKIKLFEVHSIKYECRCTKEKTLNLIRQLGIEQFKDFIADNRAVDIKCHFCNKKYLFSTDELKEIFFIS